MSRRQNPRSPAHLPTFALVVALAMVLLLALVLPILLTGCGAVSPTGVPSDGATPTDGGTPGAPTEPPNPTEPVPTEDPGPTPVPTEGPSQRPGALVRTDYAAFGANESGRVPILMFHRFVEAYDGKIDPTYTTTFDEFEALLPTLYEKGYRLVHLEDFMAGRIDVPAGTHPVVFTFDDATAGQFHLRQGAEGLEAEPRTAVGILMAFQAEHPDFGLAGTFNLNMDVGTNVFKGEGDVATRLQWMLDHGFELGNHTWGHVDFTKMTDPSPIQEAIGRNQKALSALLPGQVFRSLCLPFGSRPKDQALRPYLAEGEWEGIAYRNTSILAVGAEPARPVYHPEFNAAYIPRVRSQGKEPVEADLTWWLERMTPKTLFVSDGDPRTIVVPSGSAGSVDMEKIDGKERVLYD